MRRILYCLSHIFSQVSGRWPGHPQIEFSQPDLGLPDDLTRMAKYDWKELIEGILSRSPEVLPWLAPWCRERDPGGELLIQAAIEHLDRTAKHGAHYLTFDDDGYPPLLRCIPDAPLAFTFVGDSALFARPCISVIGSRKASGFAMRESFELARSLASDGFTVVSGGAFGCDIAAHQGVLGSVGDPAATISVAASGLAKLYPVHNHAVFAEIRKRNGVFMSERLFHAGCRPFDFAVRNRIISGLSIATCVMQAGLKSGALLTAKHALEHGREVLVLRHPPFDVRADGSRWLADDGATEFSSAQELSMSLRRLSPHARQSPYEECAQRC